MVNFKKLSLDDKSLFDRILKNLQPETSDLTFTNLFMWQHNYGLEVYYEPELEYWFLWCRPPRWKNFFLPPIGDWGNLGKLQKAFLFMKEWAQVEGFDCLIRRAPKRLTEGLHRVDPNWNLREERRTFDYLYKTSDLINLSGRKLHSKKNHLNQFLRKYQWEYLPMTPELAKECLNMETDWFRVKESPNLERTDEEQAMALVLSNFKKLGVSGGVIKIDGKIQALAVGEELNFSTVVIHIEKANVEYDGIYTAINQQFAANSWSEYQFINREEDLGIEGLRKAKLSYQPVRLVEKYSVCGE